jgi:hypothetical protein
MTIYKTAVGTATQYYLLDLSQARDATTPDRPVTLYTLQRS